LHFIAMSRKSRRNSVKNAQQPGATAHAGAQAAPAQPAGRSRNPWTLIAGGIAALVTVVVGTLLYMTAAPATAQHTEAGRTALASAAAPSQGAAEAAVHIVEFLDPACETCSVFYPYVKQMMAANPGRIRLSVRHVAFHQGAGDAVRALEAARAQDKYWQALEALLAYQDRWVANHRVQPDRIWPALAQAGLDLERLRRDMDAPEVAARMQGDLADARTLRVSKTPEYFVNGRQMSQFGLEELQALVADELRRTAKAR
jgi:protein-disulfide isomerase